MKRNLIMFAALADILIGMIGGTITRFVTGNFWLGFGIGIASIWIMDIIITFALKHVFRNIKVQAAQAAKEEETAETEYATEDNAVDSEDYFGEDMLV